MEQTIQEPKNKIEDLRNLLFSTITRLLQAEDPMDPQQARAIANVGRVIVDSAKLEVELMKKFNTPGSGFIPQIPPVPKPLNAREGLLGQPQDAQSATA